MQPAQVRQWNLSFQFKLLNHKLEYQINADRHNGIQNRIHLEMDNHFCH